MMDAFEKLANAIILQAVKYPRNDSARYTKGEIERFFHSGYFTTLTSLDPEMLIKKLHEEVVR